MATNLFAISDKVAVVINQNIVTQTTLDHYLDNFAKVSNNMDHLHDPEFQAYATKMLVTNLLVRSFAEANSIALTLEEETQAITQVMESQGKKIEDFSAMAEEQGIEASWLREFLLSSVLQQKVGMMVVAPSLELEEDAVLVAKQRFINDNTKYKLKSWTIGHEEPMANTADVKSIKQKWADTGRDPKYGEVQDLGWKRQTELPSLFIKALKGVEAGNLVGPVKSEYGYHLIWFEKESRPEMPSDSEVHEALLQEKFMQEFNEWLEDLQNHNLVIYK